MTESFRINEELGRRDGVAAAAFHLGQMMLALGRHEEGFKILERSRTEYERLGNADEAKMVSAVIEHWRSSERADGV